MASIPRKRSLVSSAGPYLPEPSQRFSPFKEMGASGVAVFGGRVVTHEKGPLVFGQQRWVTYSDMVANVSIVAASVRYFLNIISSTKWTVQPSDPKNDAAKQAAELVEETINNMTTPWRNVVRRAASYRFAGFGVQEWTAKKLDDGKIGLEDIEARPQHTIDRWDVDENGTVKGVWQVPPQTGRAIYLPRQKIMYMVEDSLTDNPEGLGIYRHLVEPFERLKKYLILEGRGFERDLRGIPIGRVPYQAIRSAVAAKTMSKADGDKLVAAIEAFVKVQSKSEDTSIVLDSAPYVVETEGGKSISGIMQYGLELLQGQAADFGNLNIAINRVNTEMARIIGTEHLLLGGEGGANRALSEDKSRNFYLTANGTLDDILDAAGKDIVSRVCDLNGITEDLRPKLEHSDVAFRSVQEVTAALRDMATAGAVIAPNDPAVNDVRDMLGISKPPELTPEEIATAFGTASETPPEQLGPGVTPKLNGSGKPLSA